MLPLVIGLWLSPALARGVVELHPCVAARIRPATVTSHATPHAAHPLLRIPLATAAPASPPMNLVLATAPHVSLQMGTTSARTTVPTRIAPAMAPALGVSPPALVTALGVSRPIPLATVGLSGPGVSLGLRAASPQRDGA